MAGGVRWKKLGIYERKKKRRKVDYFPTSQYQGSHLFFYTIIETYTHKLNANTTGKLRRLASTVVFK